jgi:exopolysaccharide biosynthesis predicted pyruvyltransferase EpsI
MSKVSFREQLLDYFILLRDVVFSLKPKAWIVASPTHSNLGDQAQLICLEKWIRENYVGHKLVRIPVLVISAHVAQVSGYLIAAIRCKLVISLIKLFSGKNDIVFGHSGYFLIDHHSGWLSFARVATACPNLKMIIMPQTINFLNPSIHRQASRVFDSHLDLTILCRDEVSYQKAKDMFQHCRLLLYPDIVTSLIGTRDYSLSVRDGVLFCVRDDLEAFYPREDLQKLADQIGVSRTEFSDTTLNVDSRLIRNEKEKLLFEFIDYVATFKVVVTDRYHGTIFSLIAQTPVVVIDSTDHKLSSGVKWYGEEFNRYLSFVEDLTGAYEKVCEVLVRTESSLPLTPYFKQEYYDQLKARFLKSDAEKGSLNDDRVV